VKAAVFTRRPVGIKHIGRTFALSDAAEAHAYIEGRGSFGRVVLVP
jgi:NADPH:quinone reductase-like Zn-dependent oxidoreductase